MHPVRSITVWEKIFTCCLAIINLKIRSGTVGYNNKILVSDVKFSLGKNETVNSLEPAAMKSHKDLAQTADLEQHLPLIEYNWNKIKLEYL